MRDDRHKWTAADRSSSTTDLGAATLTRVALQGQTLVSGPAVMAQITGPLVEWPDVATGKTYALSLRRDRVLVVNGPTRPDGWDDAQSQAVSDASDAFAVFDLTGPNALGILKRGAELSLSTGSQSVMRRVFGLDIMLYRYGSDGCYRLHVSCALQDALLRHVHDAASASA